MTNGTADRRRAPTQRRPALRALLDFSPAPAEPEYRAAMASVTVHLYASGSALVLLSAAFAGAFGGNGHILALTGTIGLVAALVHALARDVLPAWIYPLSSVAGVALVSIAVAAGGPLAPVFALLYVWIVLFAFFFFGFGLAVASTVAIAVAATAVLVPGHPAGLSVVFALLVAGAAVTAGMLAERTKGQVRSLLRASRLSEQRHRELVERLPLVVYVDRLDELSSNIYTSPQVEEMLGYAPVEWVDDPELFVKILHPDDRDRVVALQPRDSHEGFVDEYRLIARDGRTVWVQERAVVAADEDGVDRLHGILVDISKEKQLEEQLRQAQKLEAIGRLAGGVAHDFNNLLTAIIGYIDLAAGDTETRVPGTALGEARAAAVRAAELTAQLLAFGRRQTLDERTLAPNDVVAELERLLLRRLIGEHVDVRLELADDVGCVRSDHAGMEQVLVNLAINARDAMPNGGRLTITTANVDLDGSFCAEHELAPGPYVRFSVSDTGHGMDEATLARIFDPFFTTKGVGEGTGLGLATAYGTVKQSGGTMTVRSELGAGTTFEIFLPRTEEHGAAAPSAAPEPARGRETILLVEDEEVVRTLVRRILETNGYRVVDAPDGEAALAVYASAGDRPALLLSDVVMPGMRGPELAARLRAEDAALKVLLMSGYPEGDVPTNGTTLLRKPFDASELTRAVREALESRTPVAA